MATALLMLYLTTLSAVLFGATVSGYTYIEDPQVIQSLEKRSMTWEIKESTGFYAINGNHSYDRIRYRVYSVSGVDKEYYVNVSYSKWTAPNDYSEWSPAQPSDYYLVKRNWEAVADKMADEDTPFWFTGGLKLTPDIIFADEFYKGVLINTVTIRLYFNETNYDIMKYTRAEGILLFRDRSIDIYNFSGQEEYYGHIRIELLETDVALQPSFWHYIIVFLVIFATVFIVMTVVSVLISRHKAKMQIDY